MFLSGKVLAILFVPTVLLSLVLKPIFLKIGLSGGFAVGLTTGLLVMLSMRLKVPA